MASKTKRIKRDQAYKERIRQLRTGSAVPPPASVKSLPVPLKAKKTGNELGNLDDPLAFAMDEAELIFRQDVMQQVLANYGAIIRQATELLQERRRQIKHLYANVKKLDKITEDLFEQPEFAQFRLNRKVIEYLAKKVDIFDRTLLHSNPKAFMEQLERATMLIPKGEMDWLSFGLMYQLPELIKDQKFDQALIITICLLDILQASKEPNPFVTAMLTLGIDEYNDSGSAQMEAMMKSFGLNREALKAQGAPDFDSPQFLIWLTKKFNEDPDMMARFEAKVQEDPELATFTKSFAQETEMGAVSLLEGPTGQGLLYATEELKDVRIFEYLDEQYQELLKNYPGGKEAFELDISEGGRKKKAGANKLTLKMLSQVIDELNLRLATPTYLKLLRIRLLDLQRKNRDIDVGSAIGYMLLQVAELLEIEDEAERREQAEMSLTFYTLAKQSLKYAGFGMDELEDEDENEDGEEEE